MTVFRTLSCTIFKCLGTKPNSRYGLYLFGINLYSPSTVRHSARKVAKGRLSTNTYLSGACVDSNLTFSLFYDLPRSRDIFRIIAPRSGDRLAR